MPAGGAGEEDRRWMRRAVELAARGWGRVAPNPLVGCVVVRDGETVGEGWHAEYGGPHAEVMALRAAGEAARGATAYVTLEPCAHHGKTPPCTDALLAAGVSRVVHAVADPNPRAAGGAEVLRAAGVAVEGGVEAEAAADGNAAFLHAFSAEGWRPFVHLKLAVTLDGRVADRDGRSSWITGEASRAEVHRLRAGHDAVAVGIGTALADDPLLTVRGAVVPRVPPVRVVLDRRLRLPADARLVRSAREVPLVVVAAPGADGGRRRALEAAGATVLVADGVAGALRALREAGVGSLFVEGGGVLASALLRADAVDRLSLFSAPFFLGPEGRPAFGGLDSPPIDRAVRWRRLATETFGDDVMTAYGRDRG